MATQKQNRRPVRCTITIEYDLPSDYQQAQSHPIKHPSHHGCGFRGHRAHCSDLIARGIPR